VRRDARDRQDDAFPGDDAGPDNATCGNPRLIADVYRTYDQIESGLRPVVTSGAEIGALRNAAVCADFDVRQIIDPHRFAYPTVCTDAQPPGKFDSDAGLDFDALTDARSEETQE